MAQAIDLALSDAANPWAMFVKRTWDKHGTHGPSMRAMHWRPGVCMSRTIILVDVPSKIILAAELQLQADPDGYASVRGERVLSLSHLPSHLAVVETASTIIIIPWSVLNRLMAEATTTTQERMRA
jgi:hypothetical protein